MGEWVEVYNPGMTPLDLRGLRLGNNRRRRPRRRRARRCRPRPRRVRRARAQHRDGVTPLWVRDGPRHQHAHLQQQRAGDTVILDLGPSAMEIDRVAYKHIGRLTPHRRPRKSLRPTAPPATGNDLPTNWLPCPDVQWVCAGDYGSPGTANPACP